MRGAIEHQVRAKERVTEHTRAFADQHSKRLLRQIIRKIAADPDAAEAAGEAVGQALAAEWVRKHGKALLRDTVKGAEAVLDSI